MSGTFHGGLFLAVLAMASGELQGGGILMDCVAGKQGCDPRQRPFTPSDELQGLALLQMQLKMYSELAKTATAASNVSEVALSLLRHTEKGLLPIQETCSMLGIDTMGCLRVEAYIGKTLLNQKDRLHLKHKVRQQGSGNPNGEVTSQHGLQSPIFDETQCSRETFCKWGGLAEDFMSVTKSIFDMPFILDLFDQAHLTPFKYPTLVKSAPVPDPRGNHVISRLHRGRYEKNVELLPSSDIPFEQKSDTLVWRGGMTGIYRCPGQWHNGSRMLFVHKWSGKNDSRIDVGFCSCGNKKKSPHNNTCISSPLWLQDYMNETSLLKHKYIMVVEGNDVASSAEWVMASNSVPFMIPPVVQTWALHSWLQPWKHYVPLEPDFSDVSQKLDWAISNPKLAAQIAVEGASFMKEFQDKEREDRIYTAVLVTYFDRFKIEDTPEETSLLEERVPIQCNDLMFDPSGQL